MEIDSPKNLLEYFDKQYNEIAKDVLEDAVECLQESLSEEEKRDIIARYNLYGKYDWVYHRVNNDMGFHFSSGMRIRNILRRYGLADNMLPCGNWDDYYVQVIEKALGLRL
jgi:hypothetical protein